MTSFDIVVPIYRVDPDLVAECLASIRNQTHDDWICWVIDGTPSDWADAERLSATIDSFVESDQRFRSVRQNFELHPGVSGARNQAASLGSSPWIAFLDGDDWWFPENLSWITEELESVHPDTVVSWTASKVEIELTSANGWVHRSEQVASNFGFMQRLRQDLGHGYWFLMGHPPMTSQVVVRRDRFEAVDGFDVELQMAEDTECWIRMLGSPLGSDPTYRFHQVEAVGGFHRLGPNQTINGGLQTSASFDANDPDAPDRSTAFDRFSSQVRSVIGSRHPRPPVDIPDDHDVDDEYWSWLRTASGGIGRSRFLLGNAPPSQLPDFSDDRHIWV